MRLPPPTQRRTVRIVPPAAPLTLPNNDPKPYRESAADTQAGPSGLNLNLGSNSKNSKISKISKSSKTSNPTETSDSGPSGGPTPAKVLKTDDKSPVKKEKEREQSPGPVLAPQDGESFISFLDCRASKIIFF